MKVETEDKKYVTYYYTHQEFQELYQMGMWDHIMDTLKDNERIRIESGKDSMVNTQR